jgi:uncharacterized protein (TIGR02594 family)
MPKLIIPQPDMGGSLTSENPDAVAAKIASAAEIGNTQRTQGAAAAASGAGIGSVMMQAAKDLQNRSQQYFNEAQASFNDSVFNDTYAKANREYNQRVEERSNKQYDENGQPTFATLSSDIAKIGQEIEAKYGENLTNPDVRSRFNNQFNNVKTSREMSAGQEARTQQHEVAKGSLVANITQATNTAVAQPQNRDMYYTQAANAIDEGVKAGYVHPDDAARNKEKLRSDIYKGSIETLNMTDPKAVQELLSTNTPEELRLNHQEYGALIAKNSTALQIQHNRENAIQKEQEQVQLQQYNFNDEALQVAIREGKATRLDAETMYEKGMINHSQMTSRVLQALEATGVSAKQAAILTAITGDMASGTNLSSYTPSQIDDHYNQTIGLASGNGQKPLSMMQKAQIAAKYNSPVPGFSAEIKGIVLGEKDPAKVLQAVQAMDFATTQSPRLAEGVDKQTLGIVSIIAVQTKGTNQDPARVVQAAREQVMNIDPTVKEFRTTHFSEQDKFKSSNIEDTINKTIKSDLPGNVKVQPDLIPMYNSLLKEAYAITGDEEASIKMVQSWTAGTVGATKVNNTPGLIRDKQTAMMFPPEQVFPQYKSEEIRANINQSVAGLLEGNEHNPAGLTPDQVFIGSDQTTRQDLKNPSYQLYFLDKDGNKNLVLDKNGIPQHYTLDGTERAKIDQARIDGLRVQHEKALEGNSAQKELQNRTLDKIFQQSRKANSVYELAQKYVGMGEIKDNAILSQTMGKMLGQGIDPSRTPWCAAFVNTMLQANGIKGSGSLTAISFLQWGKPTSTPQQGDVVVTQPLVKGATGHVGLFAGYEYQNGHRMVKILAGNASDRVAYQTFPESVIRGYRQPPSVSELQTDPTMKGVVAMNSVPRGIRNNNPGNLKIGGTFQKYATPEEGIAAMGNLIDKFGASGRNTPQTFIKGANGKGGWSTTDQEEYIRNISKTLGIDRNQPIDLSNPEIKNKLIDIIIRQENGSNPYKKIADASKYADPPGSNGQTIPHDVYEDVARNLDKGKGHEG